MTYRPIYDQLTDGRKRQVINKFTREFDVCIKTFFNKVNAPAAQLKPVEQTFFYNHMQKKETITNEQLRDKLKTWLNHKIILAQNSNWYKVRGRNEAVFFLKNKFSSFLNFHKTYNIGQLAIDIKRNEALFETALPIPNNPSYENAVQVLQQILEKANELIKELRLESIV